MQIRFIQTANTLNNYRSYIIAAIVIAILLAFLVMPTSVVEAGRAISNGG